MWKLRNPFKSAGLHQASYPPTTPFPLCLVSFADAKAVEMFGAAVTELATQAELVIAAPPTVDVSSITALRGAQAHPDITSWTDSAAFARFMAQRDMTERSFVIRLPLTGAGYPGICASQEALKTLASSEALQCLKEAFTSNPDLAMVGPDPLFRPLFPDLKRNQPAIETLSALVEAPLLADDFGSFPQQSFAMSCQAVTRLQTTFKQYDTLLGADRKAIEYGQVSSLGAGMDLAWAAMAVSDKSKLGLSRRCLDDGQIVIRIGVAQDFAQEIGRAVDPVAMLLRLDRAQSDFDLLSREPDFDATAYLAANSGYVPGGFSALEHFVYFGDAGGLSSGIQPDLNTYRLTMGSAVAPHDNSLCHWIVRGRPSVDVPVGKWLGTAKSRRLFDSSWFAETYPDMGDAETAEARYTNNPTLWRRATSRNFDPTKIPVLSKTGTKPQDGGLRRFMCNHFAYEKREYDALTVQLQTHRLADAEATLGRILEKYGPTGPLLGAQAYLAIAARDWSRAKQALESIWSMHQQDGYAVRHKTNLLADYTTGNNCFEPVETGDAIALNKVCVYTTIFGGGDMLLPVMAQQSDVDFICISDRELEAPGWQVRVVDPMFDSSNMSAKYFKVLPHKVLPEYRYSIFVDGNTLMLGDVSHLVQTYLAKNPFVMWRHPERSDIYREAVAILQSGRHRSQEILTQIRHCAEAGLPHETGLTEGSFLWRDHTHKDTRDLMEAWWEEILAHSHRDQLSLGYLFWKRQHRPKVLPARLGTSRRNAFFVKLPHRNPKPERSAPAKASIVFLYEPSRKESGSCIMRGEQLSAMVADAMPDREIHYSSQLHWRGRILFLTKGFMEKTPVSTLQRLREQGNFLIGDFVDAKPDKEKGNCLDVLAAASIGAYEHYAHAFPNTPAAHLTHHVDPRIDAGNDANGFAPGYIGETVNAIWSSGITDRIASVRVNTKERDDSWLAHMRQFNFHYAVRHVRDIDGFKPFLKGFTAARCNAPILTQKTVGDAVYYLGEDYPFYLPTDPSETEILTILDKAQSYYDGPIWADAVDRMRNVAARTSNDVVISEFKAILAL